MPKLFGWLGGYGPQGTGGFFASQGYRHGVQMAVLAGIAEAGVGILLALGLLNPLACTAIAIVILNAIFAVTLKRGFLLGSELELMYLVTAVALARPAACHSIARLAGTTTSPASGGRSRVRRRGRRLDRELALFRSKPREQAPAAA